MKINIKNKGYYIITLESEDEVIALKSVLTGNPTGLLRIQQTISDMANLISTVSFL